ncbi:MAG: YeeE/YedE thiosulfate transporter family protein [Deltaproteobacteria bacterium]|nr:YeeE/YedE thiosulfate transporter family protein [Deltaproteobacteria bacterium]
MNDLFKRALVPALGVLFGFVVSSIGFTSFDELFAMFTFSDLRMFLSFAGAVGISVVAYRLLAGVRPLPPRRMHRGIVVGGLLFGLGWFACGACPGVAFAQLGQGKLWALVTLAGMAVGTVGFRMMNARRLHIPRDSC